MPTHPVTASPAHPEDVGKWGSRAFKQCCVDFGGPHNGKTVWYHEEARHQGEKKKQSTGKHDAATLPASYHHLDGNMTRRWKYDFTAK